MTAIRITLGGLVLLVLVLAGGWVASGRQVRALRAELEQSRQAAARPAPSPRGTPPETLLQELLDEQVAANARLQRELAALRETAAAPVPAPAPVAPGTPTAAAAAGDRATWLERLRVEDPARYEQIQREREERRQRVEAMVRDELARLDDRLQVARSQEEADLVNQLAAAVARLDELRARWQQLRELPEEERRAASAELIPESRAAYETLADLRARDRQMRLEQLASDIGYQDQQGATEFVDAVQRIYDETDVSPQRFFRWGRGGGR